MSANNTSPDRSMKRCVVSTCKGNRYELVHKFPMNRERALHWLEVVDVPELSQLPLEQVRKRFFVCTRHFRKEDYKNCESRSLNTTAYPRLHLKSDDNDAAQSPYYQTAEDLVQTLESDSVDDMHELCATKTGSSTGDLTIQLTREMHAQPLGQRRHLLGVPVDRIAGSRVASSVVTETKTEPPLKKRVLDFSDRDSDASAPESNRPRSVTVKQEATKGKTGLMVFNHRGKAIRVNAVWLRERCRCSGCCDENGRRRCSILDIPLDTRPSDVRIQSANIRVRWADKHESTYDFTELHGLLNTANNFVERCLWTPASIQAGGYARVTLNDYLCNDEVAQEVVESLVRVGCAFITNVPANSQSTEIAIKRLFPIQRTLFGEMWSLSDNKSHLHMAYTHDEMLPRNEMVYLNDAPGLQALHCVSQSGTGGEMCLVDGFYVLDKLKASCSPTYDYLCNTCVTHEYIDDTHHFKRLAPIITHDAVADEPVQLRFDINDESVSKHIPQSQVQKFQQHYRELATKLLADENRWTFQLEPGTVCILDNWRTLNGRTPCNGRRQLVGCFVSRSDFMSVARRMKYVP